MADMTAATLTMPFDVWLANRQEIETISAENTALRARLRENMAAANAPEVQALLEGLLAARYLVAFAIGQLPPETTKGWPTDKLTKFASALKRIVCDDPDVLVTANDLSAFVEEVLGVERFREGRRKLELAGRAAVEMESKLKEESQVIDGCFGSIEVPPLQRAIDENAVAQTKEAKARDFAEELTAVMRPR